MSAPRAVLSWSSGKDCAHALHLCRRDGIAEIEALLTTVDEKTGCVAMHGTRVEVLRAQARAAGLPLIEVPLPWPCSNAEYEARMGRATAEITARGIDHIVFGDLFLEDIRAYREATLEGSGLTPLFPLWGIPTDRLAREMMATGLVAQVVTCDPARVGEDTAGRTWDAALLEALPEGIDPCGENGEFHTCVTASPEFTEPLPHRMGETMRRDGFAHADLVLT
ncbi:ATPase of PP-loop superfamily Domain protein [Salipiger mucosus]|uniref:Putative ATPase of PP-loop superfamily Domain protein n=1 Tax=Salipiger mucosus DSM 16094 TaxID=1123237 RepID=S9RPK2_9RHOB|nr:ATPase of PP-loop superfamily Domain protein [Salipiger mucosus]EPX75964.1 putative ATPase of PP-loop superfamily Domain protein [Salipiger mucosus DSM 16094]